MPPPHPRSNRWAEYFVDTFKRALKKSNGEEAEEIMLQQYLTIYRLMSNPKTISMMPGITTWKKNKDFKAADNVFFKIYKVRKEGWEDGGIVNCIGRMMYMI